MFFTDCSLWLCEGWHTSKRLAWFTLWHCRRNGWWGPSNITFLSQTSTFAAVQPCCCCSNLLQTHQQHVVAAARASFPLQLYFLLKQQGFLCSEKTTTTTFFYSPRLPPTTYILLPQNVYCIWMSNNSLHHCFFTDFGTEKIPCSICIGA